ncbi:hypothetical protein I3842_14G128800 [Carya illinoinensis]|uniref:TIR domain-containing protein n=1 Tax=Carya illinoinensis TaxID=32201 RepID=A0A922AEZ8_CARIL|nr:hypothetical protein I3842_14G128800 [Carya illinoinensis]
MATQTRSSSTSEVIKKRKKRPSSSSPRWKYEVFLSFYGKDTRKNFTDHLYVDLKRKGILYVIVIFSANYAFSKWCLMELAEIVEWEEKKRLTSGSFAEALTAHEKDPKIDKKDTDMWKNALRKAGNIVGWHIHDRYESTIIQEISGRLSRELNSKFSRHDYDKLVAIDSHVDKVMKLLDMKSDDIVRFVGIHGMGGVGKTTLAEIIYDRLSSICRFEGSSFISCIREESKAREEIQIWDQNKGDRMRKKMLCNKKVFIVLEDHVDSNEQLTALAGDRKWFGPGSRMIITCRDSHLLRTHEVNHIYKVEQLETTKALQLFSLSTFKKTHPLEDYKDLSMDFVIYAQGLPLALKVLGSFLYEREIDAWKSEKDKLKAIPNPKIMDVLQISFDGLQELQKDLFLDMACLVRAHHVVDSIFYEMLESFGHYRIDIDVLVEKSLISKSKYGWLSMHDLLKEMGQEIVHHECPQEPGRRSRLGKPLKYMPTNELRFLEWSRYHSKYWPSSFQPKNLTVLRMFGSHFKQLWKGLMEFDLSYSENLIETPNLTGVPNLDKINLKGCRSLCEVHPSIGSLKRLKQLSFWAHETAITQIPSINLIPKSICSFRLKGRKLMRDPNYDIGPLVGYQMQGIYDLVEVACIDFDSEGTNILDMAGGFVASLDDDAVSQCVFLILFFRNKQNVPKKCFNQEGFHK